MTERYIPTPDEIPSGLCECGCGLATPIAKMTVRRKRYFAGHPTPYRRGHSKQKHGPEHHRWKGGRVRHHTGYILVRAPNHPDADQKGYAREHRLVMEQALGRPLAKAEHVHHINGVRDDNRPENLVVLTTTEHAAIHGPLRKYDSETMRRAGLKGASARWGRDYS